MQNICYRVKWIRKDYNLTQVGFANRLGVTNSHISAIEKGKTVPSQALAKLISKEFKINYDWLIDGKEPIFDEELEDKTAQTLADTTKRWNQILTSDNTPIRSRVAQLHELFINMLDLGSIEHISEEDKKEYLDLCYKMFYHINLYFDFKKKEAEKKQLNLFSFPDDLYESFQNDIKRFNSFFEKINDE